MHGVPKARAQMPVDGLRFSKWRGTGPIPPRSVSGIPRSGGLPTAGDECVVGFDGFGRVDRLVTHRGADVAVAADDLGDVRRQPVHDRVGDEDPAAIMRVKISGWPSWPRMLVLAKCPLEDLAQRAVADGQ